MCKMTTFVWSWLCFATKNIGFSVKDFFNFRCTPLFDVVLRILSAYMDASRAFLAHHLQSHPLTPANRTIQSSSNNSEVEREELKSALISAQESAIVQILLEICLLTEEERKVPNL